LLGHTLPVSTTGINVSGNTHEGVGMDHGTQTEVPREGRSHDELRRWLSGVADIGTAVSGHEPLTDLLGRVARTACSLMGYDFCGVFLPDPAHRALVISGYHGLSPDYVARVNAEHPVLIVAGGDGEAPTSRAYRTGEIVTLEDIDLEPRFGPWGGVAQEQGYRALVSVPLRHSGVVVGALNCYRRSPHRFDATELELIGILATQVAIALVTTRLRATEQETIAELRRAEQIHSELTATALRGEGVAGVVAALARLLHRPVLLDDRREVLARSAGARQSSAVAVDTDIGPAAGALVEVETPAGPLVGAGVLLDGEVVARIWAEGGIADFSVLDGRAMEHAAVVAALELLRERTAAEVEARLRGSLLADLLSGEITDVRPVQIRARRMGHDLTAPHALVCIGLRERDATAGHPVVERAVAAVTRMASTIEPRPLVTVHRGVIALLWPQAAVGRGSTSGLLGRARQLIAEVERTAASARTTVTISSRDLALGDLPSAFRTARGALELAGDAGGPQIIDLEEVAIDTLLLQLDDTEGLRRFARRVLGPVLDYDHRRATDLVGTARALIDADMDRRAAARTLHVHPNTVLQRMHRIEELTGLAFGRPRDLVSLTAALTVARIAAL
jgi:sugar diacid utilization regulator/putative methionine-R-sulfoxide reductase with GAF domain